MGALRIPEGWLSEVEGSLPKKLTAEERCFILKQFWEELDKAFPVKDDGDKD